MTNELVSLEDHARRQAEALQEIQKALMFLLVLAVAGIVLGLAAFLR